MILTTTASTALSVGAGDLAKRTLGVCGCRCVEAASHTAVFQDYLTKWPEAFPVANQDTITIARLLVERIVPVHGVPKKLLSDRGGCFLSHLISELYWLLGIKKINTTAYHPQTDGMVE